MAKPIVVSLDGIESSFDHIKLDRKRLYGERRRVPFDLSGEPCVKSALTSDGLYLLQSGMTAQGYFDESGRWLQKSQLIGIGPDGQALEPMPSTLGAVQPLELVEPDVLLEHVVESVYTWKQRIWLQHCKRGWLQATFFDSDLVTQPITSSQQRFC